MRSFVRRIALSRRTALLLIAMVGVLCVIGVNVPQEASTSPAYMAQWREHNPVTAFIVDAGGFDRMYSSALFLGTLLLLSAVMTTSFVHVLRAVRRGGAARRTPVDARGFRHFTAFPVNAASARATVLGQAKSSGYRVEEITATSFVARRNALSRWGTTMLHAGLLLVVASALLTFLFQQRGFVQLIEGDTFFGTQRQFLTEEHGSLSRAFAPGIYIGLDRFTPEYYPNGDVQSLASMVRLGTDGSAPVAARISVNEPVEVGGVTAYQSQYFGYTVCLSLERGGEAVPTWFSLEHPRDLGLPFFGKTDFPTTPYTCAMELQPDETNFSYDLHHPVLRLTIEEDGRTLWSGPVRPGESILFDGGRMTLVDIRRWSGLILTTHSFSSLVFTGFALILLGLISIYLFPLREIYFMFTETERSTVLSFGGVSRREQAIFAEEFRAFTEPVFIKEGMIHVGSDLVEI